MVIRRVNGFDALIIAGSLYARRWHRDARQPVRRHTDWRDPAHVEQWTITFAETLAHHDDEPAT